MSARESLAVALAHIDTLTGVVCELAERMTARDLSRPAFEVYAERLLGISFILDDRQECATRAFAALDDEREWQNSLSDLLLKEMRNATSDETCLAEDRLIAEVPAPDTDALAVKLLRALNRAEAHDVALYDDDLKAIHADARRLAGAPC